MAGRPEKSLENKLQKANIVMEVVKVPVLAIL